MRTTIFTCATLLTGLLIAQDAFASQTFLTESGSGSSFVPQFPQADAPYFYRNGTVGIYNVDSAASHTATASLGELQMSFGAGLAVNATVRGFSHSGTVTCTIYLVAADDNTVLSQTTSMSPTGAYVMTLPTVHVPGTTVQNTFRYWYASLYCTVPASAGGFNSILYGWDGAAIPG